MCETFPPNQREACDIPRASIKVGAENRLQRSDALVKKIVMENDDPWVPLLIERQSGETQLFAKPVTIEDQRYIVCRNETEAEKGRNGPRGDRGRPRCPIEEG